MIKNITGHSLTQYFDEGESSSSCGYCDSFDGFISNGMWAFRLTVQDYQDLIDRGWRRSGQYCYKFLMNKTCCPAYTIRCDTTKFTLSRSHKRVLRQMAAYLNFDIQPKAKPSQARDKSEGHKKIPIPSRTSNVTPKGDDVFTAACSTAAASPVVVKATGDTERCSRVSRNQQVEGLVAEQSNQSNAATDNDEHLGNMISDHQVTKAKAKRWIRKVERMKERAEKENIKFVGIMEMYQSRRKKRLDKTRQKTLEDYLNVVKPCEQAKHKLEIRLVRSAPASDEFLKSKASELKVYEKYQCHVHGDPIGSVSDNQFTRFLVDSPLMETGRLGSFHQQYWLDDRLIAVGVIDILPHCVSSVYLFYDPQFEFLSLGTYTALREIGFVRELQKSYDPDLRFYYMGFYIHSCTKMRYKNQYHPSYLACPETYSWQPIKNCAPLLDQSEYSRLDPDPNAKDENSVKQNDIGACSDVLINSMNENSAMSLGKLMKKYKRFDPEPVKEWASLVGKKCSQTIVLHL